METLGLVSTFVHGYKWLNVWHEKQANPPHLPENSVLLFKRFKEAYDSKNIKKLSRVISDNYQGDIFGVHSKKEYLAIQRRAFQNLPWGVNPCLTINVYGVLENTTNVFSAIIDTRSIATVLWVPTFTFDSAPVRCQIKSEKGLWLVSEMFIERRLI